MLIPLWVLALLSLALAMGFLVAVSRKRPRSQIVTALDQLGPIPAPAVVRPAFTLGGHGGGFAETDEDLRRIVERGLRETPPGGELVVLPSYTAMLSLRGVLARGGHVGEYWQGAA